jgi:endonuclease-3
MNTVAGTAGGRDAPYRVLVSTVISLRTKDEVTLPASERLLSAAPTVEHLAELREDRIARLIYPAGFYRMKARNLRACADLIRKHHNGVVPRSVEELTELPGVGRKTANLVLGIGYGIDAICVDTHVHRIANRLGWIETRTPERSEQALMRILPRRFWIPVNELLVGFGQQVCKPVSPLCSRCPLENECPKVDVAHRR